MFLWSIKKSNYLFVVALYFSRCFSSELQRTQRFVAIEGNPERQRKGLSCKYSTYTIFHQWIETVWICWAVWCQENLFATIYAIMAMENGMTENVIERIKGDSIKTTTKLVYNRTTGKDQQSKKNCSRCGGKISHE